MITKLCPHPQAATQGKCCLLMRQKFLTLQPDIFKNYLYSIKLGTRKSMDVI